MHDPDPDPQTPSHEPNPLRRRAERVTDQRGGDVDLPPADELPRLVHELRVHQVELEMQNEALREARAELERSRDRYADLYDFAPVGYLTLDERGIIREVNLTACAMLGRERKRLVGHPLVGFVNPPGKNRFYEHLRRCREASPGEEATAEITFNPHGREPFIGLVRTSAGEDRQTGARQCRAAITDVTAQKQTEVELRDLKEDLEQQVTERTSALQLLRNVASMANRTQTVEEALEYSLRRVCEHNGYTSILTRNLT